MRILVASNQDTFSEYLIGAGYQVENLYTNDLAEKAVKEYNSDVVIYFNSVQTAITHHDCLKRLQEIGTRVILITDNKELVNYAAALGITDILMLPVSQEDILYRIENPATTA